jgi:hypothetical protein
VVVLAPARLKQPSSSSAETAAYNDHHQRSGEITFLLSCKRLGAMISRAAPIDPSFNHNATRETTTAKIVAAPTACRAR